MLKLWTELWFGLYLFPYKALASKEHASSMKNIYAMYIMLCEFLISILLLFSLTYKKAEKPKTRKFSRHGDVILISFPKGKARHVHPSKGKGKNLSFPEQNSKFRGFSSV